MIIILGLLIRQHMRRLIQNNTKIIMGKYLIKNVMANNTNEQVAAAIDSNSKMDCSEYLIEV